ncbi:hypothetical protein M9H77_21730 [Catharanthus roseus]|uniref:Uncharacterized protein n=1 Tax=Catharanthus roseus TaxID=4058 RepID=A0ACC0APN1_CATRO|nr:hypothetical protein M9H77_21730 [Catharanthus roseus]
MGTSHGTIFGNASTPEIVSGSAYVSSYSIFYFGKNTSQEEPVPVFVHSLREKVAHSKPGENVQVQAWSKFKSKTGVATVWIGPYTEIQAKNKDKKSVKTKNALSSKPTSVLDQFNIGGHDVVSGALFDPNAMFGCPPHPTTKGSEFSFDVVMVDDDPSLRLNKNTSQGAQPKMGSKGKQVPQERSAQLGSRFSVLAQEVAEEPAPVFVHSLREKVAHSKPGENVQVQAWSKFKSKTGVATVWTGPYTEIQAKNKDKKSVKTKNALSSKPTSVLDQFNIGGHDVVSGALFDPNAMSGCPPHPTTKGSEFSFDVVMVDDDPSLRLNKQDNLDKSKLHVPRNVDATIAVHLSELFGIPLTNGLGTYLGIPFHARHSHLNVHNAGSQVACCKVGANGEITTLVFLGGVRGKLSSSPYFLGKHLHTNIPWRFGHSVLRPTKKALLAKLLADARGLPPATKVEEWQCVWSSTGTQWYGYTTWLACHDRLATQSLLFNRQCGDDSFCLICHHVVESSLHVLRDCPWVRRV